MFGRKSKRTIKNLERENKWLRKKMQIYWDACHEFRDRNDTLKVQNKKLLDFKSQLGRLIKQ